MHNIFLQIFNAYVELNDSYSLPFTVELKKIWIYIQGLTNWSLIHFTFDALTLFSEGVLTKYKIIKLHLDVTTLTETKNTLLPLKKKL